MRFVAMLRSAAAGLAVVAFGLAVTGCDNKPEGQNKPAGDQKADSQRPAPATQPLVPTVQLIDWCKEHAMPESICVQCNDSLAAGYKAKGDWCKEHSVPESQCLKCHPELKEKFAADFKKKFGKEPPAIEETK